ncbi:unnamed protein product, partial [Nippostrongylus brasiliensis]|uniref:DUF1758 domain-containing protein n=1 Tax=Nippostrongylus brasiliensis TaxID=27835 RepID=A0A0N4YQ79_NIPBR
MTSRSKSVSNGKTSRQAGKSQEQLANEKRTSICSQATNKQEMEQGQGFQLSTTKRRLTLFCKKLDSTIAEAREVVSNFESQKVAQEKLTALETFTKKVEEAQQEYATSLDRTERTPSAQEAVDYEQYLTMSEMTVLAAYEVTVQLQALLRDKGENVDSLWLVKQVLAKFPQQVQREILRRKCSMEEPFSMLWLLNTLDKYISSEEKIATMTSNDKGKQPARDERPAKGQSQRQIPPCMYCNQPHKAMNCTRYNTPQERANYLRQHKLCMICASPQHSTEECKRRNCFGCQGRHHTSCCFKQKVATTTPEANPTQRKEKIPSTTAKARNNNPRQQKQVKQFTTQYHEEESSEQENDEEDVESIAEFHASKQLLGIGETFLPIGELTILDPSTRKLRKIPALLDSGAECSFIDQRLADELNLPSMSNTTLRVRTFGAHNDLECQTRKVPLDIWDNEGEPCRLQLLTHNILTSSLRTPPILEEDATFIRQNQLQVHVVSKRKAKPQILLGSDQLWQLIHADKPH